MDSSSLGLASFFNNSLSVHNNNKQPAPATTATATAPAAPANTNADTSNNNNNNALSVTTNTNNNNNNNNTNTGISNTGGVGRALASVAGTATAAEIYNLLRTPMMRRTLTDVVTGGAGAGAGGGTGVGAGGATISAVDLLPIYSKSQLNMGDTSMAANRILTQLAYVPLLLVIYSAYSSAYVVPSFFRSVFYFYIAFFAYFQQNIDYTLYAIHIKHIQPNNRKKIIK